MNQKTTLFVTDFDTNNGTVYHVMMNKGDGKLYAHPTVFTGEADALALYSELKAAKEVSTEGWAEV